MPIYKLIKNNNSLTDVTIVPAESKKIEKECHIEDWIERHPFCMGLGELMILGRQISAHKVSNTVIPDLLALDDEGYIYVIELKKGRSPREIIAQSLEYAAWISELEEEEICKIGADYLKLQSIESFREHYKKFYGLEVFPTLKKKAKIVLIAEEISPTVSEISQYLIKYYGMDIFSLEVHFYETKDDGFLIETKLINGFGNTHEIMHSGSSLRWNDSKSVNEVVYEAVLEFTQNNPNIEFRYKDIEPIVLRHYPNFNLRTLRCNLYSNCVDHPSRHHYSAKHDYYQFVSQGVFKVYKASVKKSA